MTADCPAEDPRYRVRWVLTLPRLYPPIARKCMPGVSWPRRLARQIAPRTQLRDCCWHHGIDWRQASAIAVAMACRLKHEHIIGEEQLNDRAYELIRAAGLAGLQKEAVSILMSTADGILCEPLAGHRRPSYMNGRKRTHAMLESGVRRTVTVQWVERHGG